MLTKEGELFHKCSLFLSIYENLNIYIKHI